MEDKKILVTFPGGNYTSDMPLLYYAKFKYNVLGYESIKLYYKPSDKYEGIDESINILYNQVLEQLKSVDFKQYNEIVFVSKSIGTVIAGMVAKKFQLNVKHIFLTPIPQSLEYIVFSNTKLVVFGTLDKSINIDILREKCENEHVKYLEIKDVGHRLEKFGDMNSNIEILKEIVENY